MNIDIYTSYNIDQSRLKRDYIKNPLYISKNGVGSEKPFKEDLEYLYIELNIRQKILFDYFNVKHSTFSNWIKHFNIKKSPSKYIKNTISTTLQKYGVDSYPKSLKYKIKMINNNLQKYGVTYITQSEYFKYKSRKTNILKYGKPYFSQTKQYKDKVQQKCLNNYGVLNPFQSEFIKYKKYTTMIKNKSFNTSKQENLIYKLLKEKFSDTKQCYRDKRYPFNCDFYIPSLDLFIEYQGTWTHGNEPFKGLPHQWNIINNWNDKSKEINFNGVKKEYYKNGIYTWLVSDVVKRTTARLNKLNWLEFFNINDFLNWYYAPSISLL